MPVLAKIIGALAVAVICMVAAIWQIVNARGLKARGRRRAESNAQALRSSDRIVLGPNERKLYAEAQKLIAQKKIIPAAHILEQLSMQREAIQALEDNNLIHEAAKILLRMQRANRAGVVYARHGMWENAAQCFKMANMPAEVAKCAREAGNPAMAAEYFEKAGRLAEAGDSYEDCAQFLPAARLFIMSGNPAKALAMLTRLLQDTENLATLELEDREIQLIVEAVGSGATETKLVEFVAVRGKLADVILGLLARNEVSRATELIASAATDIGPTLMADVNYQNQSATALAAAFLAMKQYNYAGMVFERMNAFPAAAEAFELGGELERAAYCYERAGHDGKALALRGRPKHAPQPQTAPSARKGSRADFSLASLTEQNPVATVATALAPPPLLATVAAAAQASPTALAPPALLAPLAPFTSLTPVATARTATASSSTAAPVAATAAATSVQASQPVAHGLSVLPFNGTANVQRSAGYDDETAEHTPMIALNRRPRENPQAMTLAKPAALLTPAKEASDPALAVVDDGRSAFHKAAFCVDLDYEQTNRLWAIGETLRFRADTTVLNYADEPAGLYVITKGAISCYRQIGGKESYIDQMGPAESFGELWLLADQPTAVHFVAVKDSEIRVIRRPSFIELLDKDGAIARKLYKRFALRLLGRLLRSQDSSTNKVAS